MYSVLIQNQSTMESFHEYHPLFMEEILNKQIGVCRWIESGNSVETALPELCDMTADKENWRAIIVRVIDEKEMQEAKADLNNPYDFEACKNMPALLKESAVPLIRLTHILGGVPSPAVEFKEVEKTQEGRVTQVVYKPVKNEANEKAHEVLEEKYKFNGKRPTEILLVTFHKKGHQPASAGMEFAWTNYMELDSSEFWKRNNYPSNCRFLKYDYEEMGPIQRNADLFNFWMSVMLLAGNDINPSSLQGYRLYNIHTDFDKAKMSQSFQAKVDTLVGTKNYIGMELKRNREERASIDETAVMDFTHVEGLEINVDVSHDTVLEVSEREFNLCGKTTNEDYNKWEGMRGVVESNLDGLYKRADRELEKGTDRMRLRQHMEDEDVKPLNHFQQEDISAELDGLFVQILNGQGELEGLTKHNRSGLEEKAATVRQSIVSRIVGTLAWKIASVILLVLAVCCVPSIFLQHTEIKPTVLPSFALIAGVILCYALVELGVLKLQQGAFRKKINDYNEEVEKMQEDLENCTKNLTDFVRDVVSYARGYDYLNILEHKHFSTGYVYEALQRHMKATNLFLDRMRKWSRAFYIDTNFHPETKDNFRIDIDLAPQNNYLYTFENGKAYVVPLNETGEEIFSPFEFVRKFNIDREELFDHARISKEDIDSSSDNAGADGNSDID